MFSREGPEERELELDFILSVSRGTVSRRVVVVGCGLHVGVMFLTKWTI